MRYTQAKERCAELLRVTLGLMGRHDAAYNPITFTLWYEYAAGMNPGLHAAIEKLLVTQPSLGDEHVARLYEEHIASGEANTLQRVGGELQKVMRGITSSATLTGARAGLYGAQLNDLSLVLRANDVGALLSPHVDLALAGTAEMKRTADALKQQVSADETEIARLRIDLERARGEALIDPLTGILNRKGFDLKIAALLREPPQAAREHCLVMLDIDHFKKVNDVHGHVMGDRVIQGLGQILRQSVAGHDHVAARYGGEEFAVVLQHTTLREAQKLAEQIRLRAKSMKVKNRNTQEVLFAITLSGGVTALREGDDARALIARADDALYRSKNGGRDQVSCR